MNKRTFFFLKDSVTGKFYTGQHTFLSGFEDAAVYHKKKNAENHRKGIVFSWQKDEENSKYWISKSDIAPDIIAANENRLEEVERRRDLPNWGIEIVDATVEILCE